MKDFDIAKYLREHQLGSYGILNHYVDLKPLKEEDKTEVELNTEIPYAGPDNKLTGNGEGDAFDQAETVSEDYDDITSDRIMDLGGRQIEQGIISLMDDGFDAEDVMELCRMFIQDQYGAKAQGTPY